MFSNNIEDLRPVPTFPRSAETIHADLPPSQRLYKPAQYRLTNEKRLLSFDKELLPPR